MKFALAALPAALAFTVTCATADAAAPKHPHIAPGKLVAAAKQAHWKVLDELQSYCDSDRPIEAWLKALVGQEARAVTWTGGACQIVNGGHPGLDVASWPYCAQATVALSHPKSPDDRPMIEIYFEEPVNGQPGAAYAFRGVIAAEDWGDPLRFRQYFSRAWHARFPPPDNADICGDEGP